MHPVIIHRVATTVAMPLIAASGFAGYSYYQAPQTYPQQMVCTTFAGNHTQSDTFALQRFLLTRGYLRGSASGVFDQATFIALTRFQADNGLPVSGALDNQTRAFIQQMSCGNQYGGYQNPNGQLAAYAVDAPSQLAVGQSGTWTVHVVGNSPYQGGGQLHYSVLWGDENAGVRTASSYYPSTSVVSSGSFTHVYNRAGQFTPVFTVTDDYGHTTQVSATTNVITNVVTYPVAPPPIVSNNYCNTTAGRYDRSCVGTYPTYPPTPTYYPTPYPSQGPAGCTNYYDRSCYVNGQYVGPSYGGGTTYNGPGDTCYFLNGQWQGNCVGNQNTYTNTSYPNYGTTYPTYGTTNTGTVDYSCYYDRACLARMNGTTF